MLDLLYARAGQDIRGELLERMDRSTARRRLLVVPEQYSHETERAMCTALGGASMECEALSFTRLAGRLTDAAGGGAAPMLDAGGRMLLMYAALRKVSDALTTYRAPSRKPAFLTGLLATVDECRSYRVEAGSLISAGEELGGRQGDKLRDLGLIYAAYQALESEGAADPRGRLDRLAKQLQDTQWGAGMAFYVYGFTDFTPQEEQVLSALMAQGELTVAFVCDTGDDPSGIFQPAFRAARRLARIAKDNAVPTKEETLDRSLPRHPSLIFLEQNLFGAMPEQLWRAQCALTRITAATPRQEVEWCAAEILRLLREENYRCRDIAVCVRRLEGYGELIESTFARYGIPVFLSAMEDVLEKPVLALVTSALAAAAEDYPYEELFRYLKTGLTGITEEERDLLENYALTWDLKGSAWTRKKPWDMHPEGYGRDFSDEDTAFVARLDELRRRVIAPLEALRRGKNQTGKGRALALYQLLEDIGLPARLAQRADSLEARGDRNTAAQYRQLWDILVGGLEQCALLLGGTELELEEFSRLFSLVLSQYDVGAIPVSLDAVTVGDAPRMAHKEVKVLFLLGADSGAIPDCAPSPGLFSDQDRDVLSAMEVELAPKQEDKLRREMTIAYETCTRPSQRLYVSYTAADSKGELQAPCFLWERLAALFPDETVVDGGDLVARLSAPDAALELAGRDVNIAAALKQIPGLAERVERIQSASRWRRGRLSRMAVDELFGPVVPMSATKLDLVNSCHFSYFLRFGLDAKPRQKAAFRPSDYGTFVHDVLENTLREAGRAGISLDDAKAVGRLSQEAADRYEREVLTGLEDEPARFRYLFQRMKQAALAVTQSVCAELSVSDFTPAAFELGFGRGERKPLPPVEVEQGVRLQLSGFVDRVDEWMHNGKRYLRVVDYKTGKKSFDFADVEDGRGLQMLLYLFALSREGQRVLGPGEIVPAGVLYVPARTPLVNGERSWSDEEIQKSRDKLLRRQGLVLDDPEVLSAMERTQDGYRFLPVSTGRGGSDHLATSRQMDLLDEFITDALRRAAGELAQGNIDADPFWRGADKNACNWCDYKSACHFEEGCGDARRYRRSVRAKEFWDWIMKRKEGDKGGH